MVSAAFAIALMVLAQGAPASDPKVDFEKANRFFSAGEYKAALPFFQRAYEGSGKRPSTIRALAQCERALEMYDEAIAHFKEYLATGPKEEVQIRETIAILEEIRDHKRTASPPPAPSATPKPGDPQATAPPSPTPSPAPELGLPQKTETLWSDDPTITAPSPPKEDDEPISPWLWVAIGAAAVVAGGVVIIGVASAPSPDGGTTGIVVVPR